MIPRTLKTLRYHFTLCTHKSYAYWRLARLTGAFKNYVDLVLCIVGSDLKDIKLYVLDRFHLQRTNKFSKLNHSIYSQDLLRR